MLYCDHTIRWVFGARESDVRNVAGHIFQTVYIPLDVCPILLRRPIMVPRQMCGGVLRHYGGAVFHACNDAVPLRMDEMPGENVGIRWRGCVYCLIDLPGCRFVGPWDGIASSGFGCLYGLGATPPVIYLRRPPSLPMPVPVLRPILTSSKPKNSPTASTCDCAIPALVRFRCLSHAGAPVWGVGPRAGTSKPTSPLRQRRHYLATLRVLDVKKYADRLSAAPGPICASLGPFGRVSFKGSRSKDHGRGPPTLG
jgi:hypothetical protein